MPARPPRRGLVARVGVLVGTFVVRTLLVHSPLFDGA